ncbi:MAG: FHA domain-containing protein [Nitratireductor sp.]
MAEERKDGTSESGATRLVSRGSSRGRDPGQADKPKPTDNNGATVVARTRSPHYGEASTNAGPDDNSQTRPGQVGKPVHVSAQVVQSQPAERIVRPVKSSAAQQRDVTKPAILLHDDPDHQRDEVQPIPAERAKENPVSGRATAERQTTVVTVVSQETAVTGWLVVISGPGKGKSFELGHAKNFIGRGAHNTVPLDFGDTGISRDKAAIVVYDESDFRFHLLDGGERNNIHCNGSLVLQPVELKARDKIKIGSTTLEFIPFCGQGHDWADYQ